MYDWFINAEKEVFSKRTRKIMSSLDKSIVPSLIVPKFLFKHLVKILNQL